MLNANVRKKFTACGDAAAEELLERVLSEMKERFSGTDLCVVLGGSYGRGDGGVRQDQENGILYNDLDFFVFARKKCGDAGKVLKEIAEKYEKELKIDVDFSRIMSVKDIKNNASRLMMQELKRGYHLVYGEDLLAENLPELPAEKLPFAEACRLLLNRGMGLLLAGEKIADDSAETDFILRNINKAILGACDAVLIASKQYKWTITERLAAVNELDLSDDCKALYAEAVEFKRKPGRDVTADLSTLWFRVRDIFRECMVFACGNCDLSAIYLRCVDRGEVSWKNFIKYCIKSRTLPRDKWIFYKIPPAAVLAADVYCKLDNMPEKNMMQSKLYQQWLIFN